MGKPQFSVGNTSAIFSKRIFYLNNRLMVPKLTTDSLRVKDDLTVNGDASVGSGSAAGILHSTGNNDLTLRTGNSITGNITITDGANGNITATPNGTGAFVVTGPSTLTGGFKGGNEKVTAAKTLTAADSGKTFLLDSTAGFAITLPTATTEATGEALVGTHFRFILDVDGNNDITIIRGDTGNDAIVGHVIDAGNSFATGAAAITVASNVITFDDSASLAIGDYVDVVCTLGNATTVKYMVTGIASA
jgi:hypothetical protein